jgi:hypothetical protein
MEHGSFTKPNVFIRTAEDKQVLPGVNAAPNTVEECEHRTTTQPAPAATEFHPR